MFGNKILVCFGHPAETISTLLRVVCVCVGGGGGGGGGGGFPDCSLPPPICMKHYDILG